MSLKQKSAIGLSIFYLLSVIGVALSLHFCGGKLADVTHVSAKASCSYCKSESKELKNDNCCKNTKVDVKVKDDHQAEASFKLPKVFDLDVLLPQSFSNIFRRLLPDFFTQAENKAPPRTTDVALHVMNCVFRN